MTERRDERQERFMHLYEPVHGRLDRYCQAHSKSYEEAKDLVSETVLVAYEKFEALRNQDTFLYFLFGIARNLVLQKRRKEKLMFMFRQRRPASSLEEEAKGPAEVDHHILHHALQALSAEQREAIILFELSGFSLNEIAELQHTSLSNVKQRLLRGRAKLKALLGDKESLNSEDVVFQNKLNLI